MACSNSCTEALSNKRKLRENPNYNREKQRVYRNKQIVLSCDFSKLVTDFGGLFLDLVNNGYINEQGVVQAKFYDLEKKAKPLKVLFWITV